MKMHKVIGSALAFAVMAFVCGNALADNCNGRWTNTSMSGDTIDLGDGHTLTTFFARGSLTSDNSPMNAVGACGGYVLTTPDGKVQLAYACARKNKNGDTFSDAVPPALSFFGGVSEAGGGVSAGNASQFGSPLMMEARVSVTSSPWNMGLPVRHS